MTEKIRDLEPGDEAFILNTARTGIKAVTVRRSQDGRITATEPGDPYPYHFDAESGEALVHDEGQGVPLLMLPSDPRIGRIQRQKAHRRFRVEVEQRANDVTKNPTRDNFGALARVVEQWRVHSADILELEDLR